MRGGLSRMAFCAVVCVCLCVEGWCWSCGGELGFECLKLSSGSGDLIQVYVPRSWGRGPVWRVPTWSSMDFAMELD